MGNLTLKQRVALNIARAGRLYQRDGQLVLAAPGGKGQPSPIRTFKPRTVETCIKQGLLQRIPSGDDGDRITTTPLGDQHGSTLHSGGGTHAARNDWRGDLAARAERDDTLK